METINPSHMRLLVAVDDAALRTELYSYLHDQGYAVETAHCSSAAIERLSSTPNHDLALVSLEEPDQAGWNVLHAARALAPQTALLVLADASELDDRLRCFDLGADDIMEKPIHLEEVFAHAQAILRRRMQHIPAPEDIYATNGLFVDLASQACRQNGNPVSLTDVEFKVLKYLIRHRGRAISRDELAESVWNSPQAISPRTVDRHIAKIRQKIEDEPSAPQYIQTIYGKGYRIMPAE